MTSSCSKLWRNWLLTCACLCVYIYACVFMLYSCVSCVIKKTKRKTCNKSKSSLKMSSREVEVDQIFTKSSNMWCNRTVWIFLSELVLCLAPGGASELCIRYREQLVIPSASSGHHVAIVFSIFPFHNAPLWGTIYTPVWLTLITSANEVMFSTHVCPSVC